MYNSILFGTQKYMSLFTDIDLLDKYANKPTRQYNNVNRNRQQSVSNALQFVRTLKNDLQQRIEDNNYDDIYINEITRIQNAINNDPNIAKIAIFKYILKDLQKIYAEKCTQNACPTPSTRKRMNHYQAYIFNFFIIIDILNSIEKSFNSPAGIFRRLKYYISPQSRATDLAYLTVIQNLKTMLIIRIENNNINNINEEITLINNHLSNPNSIASNTLKMANNFFNWINNTQDFNHTEEYVHYQTANYKAKDLCQSRLMLGLDGGYCYGITFSMITPNNPYEDTTGAEFRLTQQIHNYQNQQQKAATDQQTIKRTRLTRKHFCPNKRKQATEIYNFAVKNSNRNLLLTLSGKTGKHACYISVRQQANDPNIIIRYMDPNHGVYLFSSRDDFINFYLAAAKEDKSVFKLYEIDEIIYDSHLQHSPSRTWIGKWHTLLTGPKYTSFIAILFILIIQLMIGACLFAPLALFLPASLWIAIPFTIAIGMLVTEWILLATISYGYFGLLGPVQFIKDCYHSWFTDESQDNPTPITQQNNDNITCSTSMMLQLCTQSQCNSPYSSELNSDNFSFPRLFTQPTLDIPHVFDREKSSELLLTP